ncbi:MAG: sugar ABC transporter permease [Chloroflexi bacterium]|nr:sugar ABC transporter permease [Chloroflexota bacterium]
MDIPFIPVLLISHLAATLIGGLGLRLLFASKNRDPQYGLMLGAGVGLVGGLAAVYLLWLSFAYLISTRTWKDIDAGVDPPLLTERTKRDIAKTFTVFFLVIPGMTVFFLFVLYPIIRAANYSFYDWKGFGDPTDYVKFANYEKLREHKVFRDTLSNSFKLMGLSLMVQLPLAMLLALLVGRGNLPGRRIFRFLLFVPYVFSEVIAAIIWMYVFHPTSGLANMTLDAILPSYTNIAFLGEKEYVLYAIFTVVTWKFFGFHLILYMAGLQGVPKDLEEAARVDGAAWWQVLGRVTMPLMASTIRLTVYLSVLGSFQQFVIVQVLTRGGDPYNTGHVITTYLYKYGLKHLRIGYGSAVAVLLFAMTLLFSLGYQRMLMRRDYQEAGR